MSELPQTADETVALLRDVFKRRGAQSYLGESVTMSQHMLQAAALAERDGWDDEVDLFAEPSPASGSPLTIVTHGETRRGESHTNH